MQSWERIVLIEAEILRVLEAADLGVKEILFGTKVRSGKPQTPFIQVYPDLSLIDDESLALHEDWKLRYVIVGAVKHLDPPQGYALARKLTLQASAQFISSTVRRTLDGLCNDIVRTGFVPAYDRVTNDGTIYGAGVSIEIRFTTKEA